MLAAQEAKMANPLLGAARHFAIREECASLDFGYRSATASALNHVGRARRGLAALAQLLNPWDYWRERYELESHAAILVAVQNAVNCCPCAFQLITHLEKL